MDLQSPIYKQGYGMIPKIPMRDTRLSPEAKAIYAYLCAFAGNEGAAYPSAELMCKELGMSTQHRFFKHRKQLEELGYISVQRPRLANGRLGQAVYVINEDPEHMEKPHAENQHVDKPHVENQHMEKPHVENQHVDKPHVEKPNVENPHDYINNRYTNNSLTSNSQISNSLTNTPHTPQGGQNAQVEEVQPVKAKASRKTKPPLARNEKGYAIPTAEFRPDDFEQWYAAYPRHDARDAAIPAWQKAIEENRLPALSVLLETISWQIPANDWFAWNKKHIPLPASYLNASRWQDEKPAPQPQPMNGYPRFQQTGKLQGEALHEHNMEVARIVLAQRAQARAEGKPASPLAALTN